MTEPIRILHVIRLMNHGGAESMIMNLYRHIDRTKIQFDFVQTSDESALYDGEIQALGGRNFHCPYYTGKNHLDYVKWWHDFFKAHAKEYPVIHGHLGSTAAIYLSIAKKYGCHTIAHSHSAGKGTFAHRVFWFPTRYIADSFFACSEDAAISRYGKRIGLNPGRRKVVHNAVDVKRFVYDEDSRQRLRQEWGIPEDAFVAGHVGRFRIEKNHLFLLDVFARIYRHNPDAKLLLVGDGEERDSIESKIAAEGLQDAVILAGAQKNTWDFYNAMDVFVMPSVYEGVPVVSVEAQAAGLPCCFSTGVSSEAAITDLAQFRSLEESPEQWARWILERAERQRKNMSEELCCAGYDITSAARWLQNFYLEVIE